MSTTQRTGRFSGVERADSVTWNPHKLLGVLLQCSTLHLKEKGILADCNTMKARYLFQQDKHYDVTYDTGDKVRVEHSRSKIHMRDRDVADTSSLMP